MAADDKNIKFISSDESNALQTKWKSRVSDNNDEEVDPGEDDISIDDNDDIEEDVIETKIDITEDDIQEFSIEIDLKEDFSNIPISYCSRIFKSKLSYEETISLDLMGIAFNGCDSLYFISSSIKKQLYVSQYNIRSNELSQFKLVANLPEEIYEAVLYKETEKRLYWYLLGKKTIWQLVLKKKELTNSLVNLSLTPFDDTIYPLQQHDSQRDHEGASLIVFGQYPWIIGGKINSSIDTSRRLLSITRWLQDADNATKIPIKSQVAHLFLAEKRERPIVYVIGQDIICIGGNQLNKENIVEHINLNSFFYAESSTRMLEKNHNCNEKFLSELSINSIKTASCLHENSIFIFNQHLADAENPIYYQYNFLNRSVNSSGNLSWQFLTIKNSVADELVFSSIKAVSVGSHIYLVLFNRMDKLNKTEIKFIQLNSKE
ncbi:MAG: hypothetical protein O7C55_08080 [Rickettsia endosymbiont of Ixodes persulcatus]|nr:hypothetical protein [Rickettsia endosymbiont of Ixodes persulcatus]